jgi:hypothetical protein
MFKESKVNTRIPIFNDILHEKSMKKSSTSGASVWLYCAVPVYAGHDFDTCWFWPDPHV